MAVHGASHQHGQLGRDHGRQLADGIRKCAGGQNDPIIKGSTGQALEAINSHRQTIPLSTIELQFSSGDLLLHWSLLPPFA